MLWRSLTFYSFEENRDWFCCFGPLLSRISNLEWLSLIWVATCRSECRFCCLKVLDW